MKKPFAKGENKKFRQLMVKCLISFASNKFTIPDSVEWCLLY